MRVHERIIITYVVDTDDARESIPLAVCTRDRRDEWIPALLPAYSQDLHGYGATSLRRALSRSVDAIGHEIHDIRFED